MRLRAWATAALLVFCVSPTFADGPAGSWKYRFAEGETSITMVFTFTNTEGKWVGDYIGANVGLRVEPKVAGLTVKDNTVQFQVNFQGQEFLNFDGLLILDADKKPVKIVGSASRFGGEVELIELFPTEVKRLPNEFELAKEDLAQRDQGRILFDAGLTVAKLASENKLPLEEARSLTDKLGKAAATHGPRWERMVAIRLANTFADQAPYIDLALSQARRAERMLSENDPIAVQMQVIDSLATVLTKAGKADDAKKYNIMMARLEARDAAEYSKTMLNFEMAKFAGRKAKSDRVAVLEIFTGAECPPCVAVDIAFDGLAKTFPPTDVVLLQYHFHVPRPDPLTSPAGMERVGYYGELIRGAPTAFVNGASVGRGGGAADAAKIKYDELRKAIEEQLETEAQAKIAITVASDAKGFTAKANVSGVKKPAETLKLRFVLVEEQVRYTGGNGIRYHHHVVRDLPGGVAGFAIAKETLEQTVTINVDDLKGQLAKYLNDYEKNEDAFPKPDRPLQLKKLKLIALIQDDTTKEILNATEVDLEAK